MQGDDLYPPGGDDDMDAFNDDTFGDGNDEFDWGQSQAAVVEIERERQRTKSDGQSPWAEEGVPNPHRQPQQQSPQHWQQQQQQQQQNGGSNGSSEHQLPTNRPMPPGMMSVEALEARLESQLHVQQPPAPAHSHHHQPHQQFAPGMMPPNQRPHYNPPYHPNQAPQIPPGHIPHPRFVQLSPQQQQQWVEMHYRNLKAQSESGWMGEWEAPWIPSRNLQQPMMRPNMRPNQPMPRPVHHHNNNNNNHHNNHQFAPSPRPAMPPSDVPNWRARFAPAKEWKWMTGSDVDFVLRHQMTALRNTTDYYHTAAQAKKGLIPSSPFIAPSFTPARPPNSALAAVLQGSLGRPVPKCVSTPKPLMHIPSSAASKDEKKSPSLPKQKEQDEEREEEGSQPTLDNFYPDSVSTLPRQVRLAIENGMRVLMDVQDLCIIAPNIPQPEVQARLQQHVASLLAIIHLSDPGTTLPAQDVNLQSAEIDIPDEQEFLVHLLLVNKGAKLLMRSIPLLTPTQLALLVRAVCYNLGSCMSLWDHQRDPSSPEVIIQVLCKALYALPLSGVIECMSSWMSFYSDQGLLVLLSTQCGALALATFLHRVDDERNHNAAIVNSPTYLSWSQLADQLTSKLRGSCKMLLLRSMAASGAGGASSAVVAGEEVVFDCLRQILMHASPNQKAAIAAELRDMDDAVPGIGRLREFA